MIYLSGPGHGGPAVVANTYLEGTYSEVYPNITRDEAGLKRLFKQFSFPGGIPSHVAPETPGSIHEGGELGYSLSHAFGAVFDNPDLIVACVVGDGEAETGPLATSWHSNKFLDPAHDGAVLPILHLNGYKIANPTVLARIGREELESLLRGYGYDPYFVEGHEPEPMHPLMAATLDRVVGRDPAHPVGRPRPGRDRAAPMADDRAADPQGLDRPEGGRRPAGRGDLSRAPGPALRADRAPRAPEDARGVDAELPARGAVRRAGPVPCPSSPSWRPPASGGWGPTRTPTAASCCATCGLPDFRDYAIDVPRPAQVMGEDTRILGQFLRDVIKAQRGPAELPHLRARRDGVQPADRRLRGDEQAMGGPGRPDRRPPRALGPGHGDAQRAPVRGLAGGLPAHGPPRALQLLRGVHPHHRLDVQPARQVAEGDAAHPLAPADRRR